jgi:hypothetical protein
MWEVRHHGIAAAFLLGTRGVVWGEGKVDISRSRKKKLMIQLPE